MKKVALFLRYLVNHNSFIRHSVRSGGSERVSARSWGTLSQGLHLALHHHPERDNGALTWRPAAGGWAQAWQSGGGAGVRLRPLQNTRGHYGADHHVLCWTCAVEPMIVHTDVPGRRMTGSQRWRIMYSSNSIPKTTLLCILIIRHQKGLMMFCVISCSLFLHDRWDKTNNDVGLQDKSNGSFPSWPIIDSRSCEFFGIFPTHECKIHFGRLVANRTIIITMSLLWSISYYYCYNCYILKFILLYFI